MPYEVTDEAEGCDGYAVVKSETGEVLGCHITESEAEDQLTALNIAEYGENSYHTKKPRRPKPGYGKRAPAPKKDQIVGSDENKPGSAAGKKGDIEISATTEKALQNKVDDHNDKMTKADKPAWTKVTLGALKSVYRRGAGAYSVSHRPGTTRNQWAMARVNAFLYLSRVGRPENPKYKTDFDLLKTDHPKYSEAKRSDEPRAADSYPPTDGMVEEAQRGLDWRSEYGRGGTYIGIARARDIVNRKDLPINTWRRVKAFFDRHEVDKMAEGFSPGEDGFPSNGRIAWALWGGDAGYSRAKAIMEDFNNDDERSVMDEIRDIETIYPITPLQNQIYEDLEDVVDVFGKFDQGVGAQGAHYIYADENIFASEGMVCSSCIFYAGGRACEIVSGEIDPNGLCKYWIIPESLMDHDAQNIDEEEPMIEMESARSTETRSDLYRDVPFEVRSAHDTEDGLTLTGYAAVFNRSTMIDNYEGRFEERIRPGAFKRSINAKMPVLQFEHGRHPLLGSMPLGQITKLREDEHGLYVEARLADNWLIQPVRDAIASGAIDGMSFRFQVVRDSVDESGDMPVRTLEEVKLLELGPVVFPAYAETSVGVRSADLSPLFSLPQDDRHAIARALVLGTQPEPAIDGTSERPAESTPDSPRHSGLTHIQRSHQLREIEGVL